LCGVQSYTDTIFQHCIAGASIWKFASVDEGINPDVYVLHRLFLSTIAHPFLSVLVGIGVELTFEVIAAAALLRKHVPDLRVRVVNVTDLMILGETGSHPHALDRQAYETLFTADKPVHYNYHGYPIELKGLLWGRSNLDKATVEGYREEGTTTSPFDVSSRLPLHDLGTEQFLCR
jgi:xylulose-5-phosphate/fructose-6-phosphate phosphoketolase